MIRPSAATSENSTTKDLLIANGTVVTMNAERRIITEGAVLVRGDRIQAVGKAADLKAAHTGAEVVDATDMLVIPGLIDGHNHPIHYLSKGLLDDMEVKRRWSTRLYPFEADMVAEDAYWGSLGSFAEMIRSGTACVADRGSFHTRATLEAARRIGIRAAMAPSMRDIDDYAAQWEGPIAPQPPSPTKRQRSTPNGTARRMAASGSGSGSASHSA